MWSFLEVNFRQMFYRRIWAWNPILSYITSRFEIRTGIHPCTDVMVHGYRMDSLRKPCFVFVAIVACSEGIFPR